MPSPLLIPTACHSCNRAWLAPPPFEQTSTCPVCHGPADVVPGECYRAEDIPLFEKIERSVHEAQLSEQSSYQLWVMLSNASERWRRPEDLMLPVITTIPTLRGVVVEMGSDRAQIARAVGMSLAAVATQLRSFEARRRSSGGARVVSEQALE